MNVGKLHRTVTSLISSDDLGSHIAHLSKDSKVLLVCCYVIVVANEKRACRRIKEKASIVYILIRIARLMKLLECGAKGYSPLKHHTLVGKFVLAGEVRHK